MVVVKICEVTEDGLHVIDCFELVVHTLVRGALYHVVSECSKAMVEAVFRYDGWYSYGMVMEV